MTEAGKTFEKLMHMGTQILTQHSPLLAALERAGCATHKTLVREEVRKNVYVHDTEAVWGHGAETEAFEGHHDRQSDVVESRVITPAVYAIQIPPHIDALYRYTDSDSSLVVWMLETFSSLEIDAMYRLGGSTFRETVAKAYRTRG